MIKNMLCFGLLLMSVNAFASGSMGGSSSLGNVAFSGQNSGGGSATLANITISADLLESMDRKLFESGTVRVHSSSETVNVKALLQDFQTIEGQRGIVVQTEEGMPRIMLEDKN